MRMVQEAWNRDDKRNIRLYTDLLARYGSDVRALDWGSRESQQLRFSVLAKVGQLNGASVLDVGCGMGDFYNWFKEANLAVKYTGIDITPKMIEFARQRFPEAHFELKNLLEETEIESYDFVFASGIFTHRKVTPFAFLSAIVKKMFSVCNIAVAFNSLSDGTPMKQNGEFYAVPAETLTFCRILTPWVVLRHDYHPRDFTVYLYKRQNS